MESRASAGVRSACAARGPRRAGQRAV